MTPTYSLEEAKEKQCCRICGSPIPTSPGSPMGWQEDFGERLFPQPALVLNFGKEFAHKECLEKTNETNC